MNIKEIALRSIRHTALASLYAEMWHGLKWSRPGDLHRALTIVTPVTARWLLAQLDVPRSIATVHGVQLSLVSAGIAEAAPCSSLVMFWVDYFVPAPVPELADKRKAWLAQAGPRFKFLPR